MKYHVTNVRRFSQQHDAGFYYVAATGAELMTVTKLGRTSSLGSVLCNKWTLRANMSATEREGLLFTHPAVYEQGKLTDLQLASGFNSKAKDACRRNIEFSLTLPAYRALRKATKCAYTGDDLNFWNFSIDRIDSSKGYEVGNVVACTKEFNQWKGHLENPDNSLSYEKAIKAFAKIGKYIKAAKK